MEGIRLTPEAICSGLRIIQTRCEKYDEDFDIVFTEGEYGKGQHRIDVSFCRLLSDAIELLKEQEAIKPKSKVRHGANAQIQHFCGNCNTMLHGKPKFCSECGRTVKWND